MRKRKLFQGKRFLASILAVTMAFGLAGTVPEGGKVQAAENNRQVLTVDMKETTGDILHGAAGFLYGISNEEIPTNNTMVPLKPKVLCTKGALGTEHPYGDALDVAKSFLESGGEQVMMYNSNYYGVFGVTANHKEYAEVLKNTIAPAVVEWKNAWKRDHANDNLNSVDIDKALIYIPINEGTPKNDTGFNQAWEAYYDAIKEGDPAATIAGPNSAKYNEQFENQFDPNVRMDSHIQYCADNDCMPDIITWHELEVDKLEKMDAHIKDFKRIWNSTDWTQYQMDHPEKFAEGASVPEIPQICINEYADFADCGVPGRLVNWIARLEDQKIYGCLPFWHQANNLNDLTADANQGNGAWWLFKWYGDMSGETVKVSSSTTYDKLYGVASVDDTKKIATTLLGGVDGKADVSLLHVDETGAFRGAEKVHVKVQSTAFSGYHGAKEGTPTILEGTYPVNEDGSVRITLDNMKFSTAYNVTLTEEAEEADSQVSVYQKVYEAEEGALDKNCILRGTDDYNPRYYISANRMVEMPAGAVMTYKFEVPVAGKYRLDFIYGNGTGSSRNDMRGHNPQNVTQTFSVDGEKPSSVVMENTLLDNMTGIKTRYADLEAGTHTVQIKTAGSGRITHDCLTVTWHGAKDQEVKAVNERFEAEHADFNMLLSNKDTKVRTKTELLGYSSNGYVTGLHERSVPQGGGIRWNVVVAESGIYNLTFRYQSADRGNLNLYVGNTATELKTPDIKLAMKNTANAWAETAVSIYLQKGINIVDVDTTRASALDYMQVQAVTAMDNSVYETTIEAENCIPAGSAIQTALSAGASGGKYVVGMEGASTAETDVNKYLEFKYTAPRAGIYQMRLYQSNNDICGTHWYNTKIIDKYASVKVNSQEAKRYFFINTFSDDTFKEKTIALDLQEGENTIRIYNDDSWHVKWGGTTALPGTNELKNYAPNFDRFVIMPSVLEDTIALAKEFGIEIAATGGGYATTDKNTVKSGGQFQVTIAPNQGSGLVSVAVNGKDATKDAKQQEDGTYLLKIANVQSDVKVQIKFEESNTEHKDKYIKNAGFGTGNTDKWTAAGTEVKSSAADSYEGFYAVLGKGSSLSQTISLQPGKYALTVYSKGKGSVQGNAVLKAAGTSVNLNTAGEYQENRAAFELEQAGTVEIKVDAAGLNTGNVLVDNFSLEELDRNNSQVSKQYQYLVDCGDYDPDTVGDGEKFGQYNSVTDQAYQKDIFTGKSWGVVTTANDPVTASSSKFGGNGVYTKYQWANENQSGDVPRAKSFRYAHGQDTAGINPRYVKYRFEVEPGTYQVTVGMGNTWNNAGNPDVYAGTGDSAADTKLNTEALAIPHNGNREVSKTVTVAEGSSSLDVYALSQEPTIQMNYIQIAELKSEDEAVTSLTVDASSAKVQYMVGEDLDTAGLAVTAKYKNGTETVIDISDCVLEGFDSSVPGTKSIVVKYTEGAQTVQAQYTVTVSKAPIVSSDDGNLLYFVDCGDFDPETTSEGDAVSTNQSVTDKIYGADTTGKKWGLVISDTDPEIQVETGDDEENNKRQGSKAVFSKYQWAHQRQTGDTLKTESFRYARAQKEANINPRYVKYRFEVEPGEYLVTVGMGNSWGNAANPDVYAGTGDSAKDTKLNAAALNIPRNGSKEAKGKVVVAAGTTSLDVYALSKEDTLQMNYIFVQKAAAAEEELKPARLVVTSPAKTVYKLGENLDLTGLKVKAVYNNGQEKELANSEYTVRDSFEPNVVGGQTIMVSYTEKGVTVAAGFAVSVRAARLTELKLVSKPVKTQYQLNESQVLDIKGLAVKAVYSDGAEEALKPDDCEITGFSGGSKGMQTITVSYTEGSITVETSFQVEVLASVTPPPAAETYKVIYHDNNGGKVSGMPSDTKDYAKGEKAAAAKAPVSTSKFFAGWNTQADGKGTGYAPGSTITVNGEVHLYAQWKTSYTAKNKLKYKVTGTQAVSCVGTANKKATSVKVPATIKYSGITYKVTSIGAKAFAKNKKIKKVTIANNVKTIKTRAFENCKNLKSITVGTGLTTIEKYAFSGEKKGCVLTIKSKRLKTVKTAINHKTKNMTVKVPKSKLKAYKKLLNKKAKNLKVVGK
ncbi:MAG: leucine-rich repeat protein [Lachnospiraceae bacterium]|nr:leucine-rich repeat protein [Lachnospiraceae bacterium]